MIWNHARRDASVAEGFAQRILQIYNNGALNLMISIGHQTGLFDHLASMPPSTAEQIADRAGLDLACVRAWLGAMVTGGLVEYDPVLGFHLPGEHAAMLARHDERNLAGASQWLSVMAEAESDIVDRFRRRGSASSTHNERFQDVVADDDGAMPPAMLDKQVLALAPGLREMLEEGGDVLESSCGGARMTVMLAARYPKSRFTGVDACQRRLEEADRRRRRQGSTNVTLVRCDPAMLRLRGTFDLATAFGSLHSHPRPADMVRSMATSLRDDGLLLLQELAASCDLESNLDHPLGSFLYATSCMQRTSTSQADPTPADSVIGREVIQRWLREAGLQRVLVRRLEHDPFNEYYLAKKR